MSTAQSSELSEIRKQMSTWALELGFQQLGVSGIDLSTSEQQLKAWLALNYHGDMGYMAAHGNKRSRPGELETYTLRVISVRMNYLSDVYPLAKLLEQPQKAAISRYALGRDYHKMMRKKLQKLSDRISAAVPGYQFRALVDSAPVMEKPLAQLAGLGWQGKHTNLINKGAGSWFFLGELYTDLPLGIDEAAENHCGSCSKCIPACPTEAIIAPYKLDARRCISYLTIEHKGSIPVEFRAAMGNRIFGCDDCQLVCPWNKFAKTTPEADFQPRHGLDAADLLDLFNWTESEFLQRTEGSAIRRIGHQRWLRNIAVALGNAKATPEILAGLAAQQDHPSAMVREHVDWAIGRLGDVGCEGGN